MYPYLWFMPPSDQFMKWTVILLLLWFTRTSAQDHTPRSYNAPDLSFYHLKGPVAQVRQLVSFSDSVNIFFLSDLGMTGFDSVKDLALQFDSTGRLVYRKETALKPGRKKEEINTEWFYTYFNSLMSIKTTKENGRATDSTVFDYDRYKRISSYRSYDSKGRLRYKYTFTYNSRQQLTTIRRKNEENFPVEMIKLKYHSSGHLTEQQFFDDNMKKIKTVNYNSRLSDSTGFYNGSILTYSETGQLISGIIAVNTSEGLLLENSVIDSTKKVTDYRMFRYNDQNDIEEEKLFANMENVVVNYKYKYDESGNWTEKVASVNGNLTIVTTRSLEYFK